MIIKVITGLLLVVFLFVALRSRAQTTIRITGVPESTQEQESLYLAGSFNGWNPADSQFQFQQQTDGTYSLTLNLPKGIYSCKVTRGSSNAWEADSLNKPLRNRELKIKRSKTLSWEVQGWEDFLQEVVHTAQANVQIIAEEFAMPQLETVRRIWVYFPPDYDTSSQSYPVWYMHDGQNLFDDATSFSGEWGVDESLNELFEQTGFGVIVVGIDNGGSERLNEYSPWVSTRMDGGGKGDAYLQFIVETLKPHIDSTYRTLSTAENTGIGGSSMGGLISFCAAMSYPHVFGKAAVFSPSFWFSEEVYTLADSFEADSLPHIYFLAGEKESASLIPNIERMVKILKSKGFTQDTIKVVSKPDGEHSEWFWRREFPDAFNWLHGL